MNIPLSRPTIGCEEINAIKIALESGWVTQGPRVLEFEKQFAATVGAEHAIAVSNCTDALSLALRAVGVEIGDVVITVSHSFIATANSIRTIGAEPYFVDIELLRYGMCPTSLESVLSELTIERDGHRYIADIDELATEHSPLLKLKSLGCSPDRLGRVAAILVVHQMGIPARITELKNISSRFTIPLVEDAACALGSISDKPIGSPHGLLACFSLHPRKVITTGEGGVITTNDPWIARKIRLARHNGMEISDLTRHNSSKFIQESYLVNGENSKMTDIQAAMGLAQLNRLSDLIKRRRELGNHYRFILSDFPEQLAFPDVDHENWNYQSFPIRFVNFGRDSVRRLVDRLFESGVSCRHGIMNSHEELPYSKSTWNLPNSCVSRDSTMLLPLFSDLSTLQIDYVCNTLRASL